MTLVKPTYIFKPVLSGEQIKAPSIAFFNRPLTLTSKFEGRSACINTSIQALRKLHVSKKQ